MRGPQESSPAPCCLPLPPPLTTSGNWARQCPWGRWGSTPCFHRLPRNAVGRTLGPLTQELWATRPGGGRVCPQQVARAMRMDVHRVGEGVQWKEAVPWSGSVWVRGPSLVWGLVRVTVGSFIHSSTHPSIHSLTTLCHTSLLTTLFINDHWPQDVIARRASLLIHAGPSPTFLPTPRVTLQFPLNSIPNLPDSSCPGPAPLSPMTTPPPSHAVPGTRSLPGSNLPRGCLMSSP